MNEFDTMDEHQHMVSVLVKSPAQILGELSPNRVNLFHGVIGVVGEVGEIVESIRGIVDRVNLVEELGDIEFYMAQTRMCLDIPFEPIPLEERGTRAFNFHKLVIDAANLLDRTKKVVIYNQEIEPENFAPLMYAIDESLNALREAHAISRQETLQGNIDKLAERYPGFTYTDQRAADRMDKAE